MTKEEAEFVAGVCSLVTEGAMEQADLQLIADMQKDNEATEAARELVKHEHGAKALSVVVNSCILSGVMIGAYAARKHLGLGDLLEYFGDSHAKKALEDIVMAASFVQWGEDKESGDN